MIDDEDDSIDDAMLLRQGRALVESIVELARVVPAGGDARWDAMLGKLGVNGLPNDERLRNLRDGPGQRKGALVIELRWALAAAIAPLAEHMDDRWALRELCSRALRDYVEAVKPTITTSSIFANALATTGNQLSGKASAAAQSCRCCGGPLVDPGAAACRYCGEPVGNQS